MAAEIAETVAYGGMLRLLNVFKHICHNLPTITDPISRVQAQIDAISACLQAQQAQLPTDVDKITQIIACLTEINRIEHPMVPQVSTPVKSKTSISRLTHVLNRGDTVAHALKIAKQVTAVLIKQYQSLLADVRKSQQLMAEAMNTMSKGKDYLAALCPSNPPPPDVNMTAQALDLDQQERLVTVCGAGDDIQVSKLLNAGGDPYHPSNNGVSPLQAALQGLNMNVVAMIEEKAKAVGRPMTFEYWQQNTQAWFADINAKFIARNLETYDDFSQVFTQSTFLQQRLLSEQACERFVREAGAKITALEAVIAKWVLEIVTIENASADNIVLKMRDGTLCQYALNQVVEVPAHQYQLSMVKVLLSSLVDFIQEKTHCAKAADAAQTAASMAVESLVEVGGKRGRDERPGQKDAPVSKKMKFA